MQEFPETLPLSLLQALKPLQEFAAILPLSSRQALSPLQDPGATVPVAPSQAPAGVQVCAQVLAGAAPPHTSMPSANERLATNTRLEVLRMVWIPPLPEDYFSALPFCRSKHKHY